MQYLLSEDEMGVVEKDRDAMRRLPTIGKLQEFCTMIADSLPVTNGWYKGKVWGCILTVKREWYCDDCPARAVCPHSNKHFSK